MQALTHRALGTAALDPTEEPFALGESILILSAADNGRHPLRINLPEADNRPMDGNLITIENRKDPYWYLFQRVMRMVPDRDRNDPRLQRLLAFRLRRDGEAATHEYLIRKVRDRIRCRFEGSLYEFLKDDRAESDCGPPSDPPTAPPDVA